MTAQIRLGADIGGTFTDIALEAEGALFSTKVLTNYAAPEQAILDGMDIVLSQAGLGYADLDILIHGTTLATNALIERRGARTAFVTTEGFRDVIEMRTESRFDQHDLNLLLPTPLVPREDRFAVAGRIDARGQELQPLDEAALQALAGRIAAGGYAAVAIGFIHSYLNPAHEQRARQIIAAQGGAADFDFVRSLAADARVRAVQHCLRQCLCAPPDGRLPWPAADPAAGKGRRLPGLHDPFRRRADLG